jgi:hypothetical protein
MTPRQALQPVQKRLLLRRLLLTHRNYRPQRREDLVSTDRSKRTIWQYNVFTAKLPAGVTSIRCGQ